MVQIKARAEERRMKRLQEYPRKTFICDSETSAGYFSAVSRCEILSDSTLQVNYIPLVIE